MTVYDGLKQTVIGVNIYDDDSYIYIMTDDGYYANDYPLLTFQVRRQDS